MCNIYRFMCDMVKFIAVALPVLHHVLNCNHMAPIICVSLALFLLLYLSRSALELVPTQRLRFQCILLIRPQVSTYMRFPAPCLSGCHVLVSIYLPCSLSCSLNHVTFPVFSIPNLLWSLSCNASNSQTCATVSSCLCWAV